LQNRRAPWLSRPASRPALHLSSIAILYVTALGLVLPLAVISLPLVVRNAVEICVIESALKRGADSVTGPFLIFRWTRIADLIV
jgi:hypothetical protein